MERETLDKAGRELFKFTNERARLALLMRRVKEAKTADLENDLNMICAHLERVKININRHASKHGGELELLGKLKEAGLVRTGKRA